MHYQSRTQLRDHRTWQRLKHARWEKEPRFTIGWRVLAGVVLIVLVSALRG